MRIIKGPRQSGKTTELIKLAAEHNAYIVVPSYEAAEAVAKKAREMGLDIPFPTMYSTFMRGEFYARGIRAFIIDNVDALVQYMAGRVPVIAISMTEEPSGEG